jgi:hypothetical protein
MNKYIVAGVVVAVLVAGIFVGAKVFAPQLAGDFAGGITSNLLTCSAGTNSCTPNLSNFYVNGGISAGGTAAANQVTMMYTATTTYLCGSPKLQPP